MAFLWIDYKAKPLSRRNRESQTEAFGKKGLSLFGLAAMFLIPSGWQGPLPEGTDREGDVLIAHVRVACDDSDQSVWHSLQVLTTALLLLRAQYPFLKFGPLYSDGAVNFKSFLFTLMLPDVYKRTGFRVADHLLPEAGDGKDRCDRDFAGVNKLFDSWVKVERRVMLTADDICDALEAGKTTGVTNCSLQTQRDKSQEKAWKEGLDTALFAQQVGKKREDLFYIKIEWKQDGQQWVFQGMTFFAYHEMGTGKFLSHQQLQTILPGSRPPVLSYVPFITRGSKLNDVTVVVEVKIELGREHKKRKVQARVAKKDAKQSVLAAKQAQEKADVAARSTCFRCPHCDQPFLQKGRLLNISHIKVCSRSRNKSSQEVKDIKGQQAIVSSKFALFQGHEQMLKPTDDTLIPLSEACASSMSAAVPCLSKPCRNASKHLSAIPHSVSCLVRAMVDTIVFNSGDDRELPLRGWASREANVRSSERFGDEVKAQLLLCFDRKQRMNAHHIEQHLAQHFGKYAGPKKCLRGAQISSWVGSEVQRRKKKALGLDTDSVLDSLQAVAARYGTDSCATESSGLNLPVGMPAIAGWLQSRKQSWRKERAIKTTAANLGFVCWMQAHKSKWRQKRGKTSPDGETNLATKPAQKRGKTSPDGETDLATKPVQKRGKTSPDGETDLATKPAQKRGKTSPDGETDLATKPVRKRGKTSPDGETDGETSPDGETDGETSPDGETPSQPVAAPHKQLLEVINKRGKRCEYEYECRWVGIPADHTDWVPNDELTTADERQAIDQFEEQMRAQRHGYCLKRGEVKTLNCCNSVVKAQEVDAKGYCIDQAACQARLSLLCSQPAPKRRRKARTI